MTAVVGIDVGATGIKAALFDSSGEILRLERRPTPRKDSTGAETAYVVADLVADLAPSATTPVGVAAPGIVDEASGVVVRSVNLGWENVVFRDLVEERVGRGIAFGHDVRLGGLAEDSIGAASSRPGTTVFVPIGTGISLAIIVDGVALTGRGWVGEIGLTRLAGRDDGATLETAASASGLARELSVRDGEAVVALVVAGDPVARRAWEFAIESLTDALAWTTAIVAPDTIVVGGGLALSGDILLDPLRAALARRLPTHRLPALLPAALGDLAACHGSGLLARRAE